MSICRTYIIPLFSETIIERQYFNSTYITPCHIFEFSKLEKISRQIAAASAVHIPKPRGNLKLKKRNESAMQMTPLPH